MLGLLGPIYLPEAGLAGIQKDVILPTGPEGVELVGLLEEVRPLPKPIVRVIWLNR